MASHSIPCVCTDLEKRKEELEKINSLDRKIGVESDFLRQRIKAMTAEMAAFKTEEQLQEESNQAKKVCLGLIIACARNCVRGLSLLLVSFSCVWRALELVTALLLQRFPFLSGVTFMSCLFVLAQELTKQKLATKKQRDAIKLHVQQLSHAMEKKKKVLLSLFVLPPAAKSKI